VVGREHGAGQRVLEWAEPGKSAVLFGSAARGYGYVYTDRFWYSASCAQGDNGWWRLVRAEPEPLRGFCGSHEQLARAAADVVAGKEVVVPCLSGAGKEDLRDGRGQERQIRAGLRLLDYNPGRDLSEPGKGVPGSGQGR
jgi:hypothetical protein